MNVGVFTGDSDPSDQEMFIVEKKAFKHLCDSLVRPCSCHFSVAPWKLDKVVQVFIFTSNSYVYMYSTLCYMNIIERTCFASNFQV